MRQRRAQLNPAAEAAGVGQQHKGVAAGRPGEVERRLPRRHAVTLNVVKRHLLMLGPVMGEHVAPLGQLRRQGGGLRLALKLGRDIHDRHQYLLTSHTRALRPDTSPRQLEYADTSSTWPG